MDKTDTYEIGYIMKGYPRNSEAFISHEIHLLESMGLRLRIFSVMKSEEENSHAVVSKIKADVAYLPEVEPKSDNKFLTWLGINLPLFIGSHINLMRLRPKLYIQTFLNAVNMAFKYRSGSIFCPKRAFLKDFIRAGYIALNVIKSGYIKHLHGHFCHGSTTITMFASRLSNVPFSFTAHAKDIYLPKLNPGDLLQVKIRNAQFVVTCTDANRKHMERLCPGVKTIHTIYHGLDTSAFAPKEQQNDNHDMPIILSVGRFVEKKGFEYLVKACKLLKDRRYTFQCHIVGEADEQTDKIVCLIKELKLTDTVVLKPATTQEELVDIYNTGTVFVLPCQIAENGDRDGIPNVLVEVMALGIPVVSTDVSGIPELIDNGVNGLLVPSKDDISLANSIELLLKDSEMRKRLGSAARNKICKMFVSKETTIALKTLFTRQLEINIDKKCLTF